jgi:hypothetical protein
MHAQSAYKSCQRFLGAEFPLSIVWKELAGAVEPGELGPLSGDDLEESSN